MEVTGHVASDAPLENLFPFSDQRTPDPERLAAVLEIFREML